MADELKGKIYEVLSIIAIKKYTNIINKGETLFWNKQPKEINVEPDITIGVNSDYPRLLMLVTHTSAERASDKKFWRNMGEFVDARVAFGNKIRIVSVNFDSVQKRRLATVSDLMFDGMIEVDRTTYGTKLIAFANQLVVEYENLKVPVNEKLAMIEEQIVSGREEQLVKLLAKDLQRISLMESSNSKSWYSAFSSMQGNRAFSFVSERKCTYIRRGLGRLLPITDIGTVKSILYSIRHNTPIRIVPDFFIKLNLAHKTVGGYKISQDIINEKKKIVNELYYLGNILSDDDILKIWNQSRSSTTPLNQVCLEIVTGLYSQYHNFIIEKFESLIRPNLMAKALEECFFSPDSILNYSIIGLTDDWRAWLFDYIMTIIKAKTGKQQGYGYSRLVVDSGLYKPGKRSILDFVLPEYNSRSKMLDRNILEAVARVLSSKLEEIGLEWIKDNEALVHAFYLRILFEDKIYKAANYDPIQIMITDRIHNLQLIPRYPTLLTEFLNAQNSTCFVLKSGSTIIMWQSAYGANCGHKFNELVGRIGMLRTKFNSNGNISVRKEVRRALLVIDGTWSEKHIQCLHRAGFDGIYYPDEIDKLKAAIV